MANFWGGFDSTTTIKAVADLIWFLLSLMNTELVTTGTLWENFTEKDGIRRYNY